MKRFSLTEDRKLIFQFLHKRDNIETNFSICALKTMLHNYTTKIWQGCLIYLEWNSKDKGYFLIC